MTDYQPIKEATDQQVYWYPMRVTYHRELKVKEALDSLGIESFLPMQYKFVDDKVTLRKKKLVPAIHNLLFIHSTRQHITTLKTTRPELSPLRYMTDRTKSESQDGNGRSHILIVPDRQMKNFMQVAAVQDDRIMYLETTDFINKIGRKVRITEGAFAGVEGEIKRIKGNRRVVVRLEGITAVAITFVSPNCIEFVE